MKRTLVRAALGGLAVAAAVSAAAALPAAADHGHGVAQPSPSPSASGCTDSVQGSLGYTRDRDPITKAVLDRGVAAFSISLAGGADSCPGVTYAASVYTLKDSDGNGTPDSVVELAHADRAGDGEGGVSFRLPVAQYSGDCVYASIRIIADGQVTDVGPDDPANPPKEGGEILTEDCDGGGVGASSGWG